jgi:hypothetical protein
MSLAEVWLVAWLIDADYTPAQALCVLNQLIHAEAAARAAETQFYRSSLEVYLSLHSCALTQAELIAAAKALRQ